MPCTFGFACEKKYIYLSSSIYFKLFWLDAKKEHHKYKPSPYHITIRSNNREWFDIPLNEVWDIYVISILKANASSPVKIQAFLLMSNQYHLVLWTPDSNLDKFMYVLNSSISKMIRQRQDVSIEYLEIDTSGQL